MNSRPMSIKLKRRLTYATILLYNLCTGIGYAIVFPTIWNYIHERLGGKSWMLGIAISAYSISAFFSNPLVGWWNDRTHNTQSVLLMTVCAEIIGSFMYFLGISTWFVVLSRLVAGFGGGGGAAVFADITRTTSEAERTPVLAVVVASRQLGLLIGPAFNLFLSQLDFHIFYLPVDKYTSPGLFMALLWMILEIMIFFAYHNLTVLKNEEDMEHLFDNYKRANSMMPSEGNPYGDLDQSSSLEVAVISSCPGYTENLHPEETPNIPHSSSQPNLQAEWLENRADNLNVQKREIKTINCQKVYLNSGLLSPTPSQQSPMKKPYGRTHSVSNKMIESAERLIQSTSESYGTYFSPQSSQVVSRDQKLSSKPTTSSGGPSTPYDSSFPSSAADEKTSLLGRIPSAYLRDEIIVLLGLAFISCLAQTVLETVVTPLAQKYYNFTEMDNSWIYLLAGVEVIFVFAVIKYISRRVSDRSMLIVGLLTLSMATGMPLLFVPSAVPGETKTLPFFILTIIVDLVGIAIIVVCSSSLLSKLTSDESQAMFQGLRRSMSCLGCIMGPLWGGAFLFNLYLLFAIPMCVTVLIMILFLCSFKKFKIESTTQ